MKKITIILTSTLTVPAIKGGAVEVLLENFIKQNEIKKNFQCTVIAHYLHGVRNFTRQYKYANFIYIRFPTILMRVNSVIKQRCNKIPSIYGILLQRTAIKAGNKNILIEGSGDLAVVLKKMKSQYYIYWHTHGPFYGFNDNDDIKAYKDLSKTITVSDFCRKQHITFGAPPQNVITVKNGIETSRFHMENIMKTKEEIYKKYNLPSNKKIILFKGRMVKEKGIMELIKAFSGINNDNIFLLIAGSKNFGEKRKLMSKYEMEIMSIIHKDKRIKYQGYVPYQDIPELHKTAHICVVPSVWDEPFALVILEAIASETPLIISNAGGMPELAGSDYVNIIARDKNYVENLRRAMIRLIEDEKYYCSMKERLRTIRDEYSAEKYYDDLCRVLN